MSDTNAAAPRVLDDPLAFLVSGAARAQPVET